MGNRVQLILTFRYHINYWTVTDGTGRQIKFDNIESMINYFGNGGAMECMIRKEAENVKKSNKG